MDVLALNYLVTSTESQYSQRVGESFPEVSYSVFTLKQQADILPIVATAINVQLKLNEQDGDIIPFVAPTNFQLANSQDKLLFYGPGGSGKSRLIFELVRAKLDQEIERLYIINPRQVVDKNIQRANLMQLSSQFTCRDIVVWDNFPDGLMKKDTDAGKLALEVIGSGAAKNLFISLNPKFLETYRGIAEQLPDLYAYQIRYDINEFKEIVKLYGTRIAHFKESFTKHVAQNITSITKVLWQKEPFPLTIFNYYRELATKQNSEGEQVLDAVVEAQSILYPTSYYEYQFEQLVNSNARISDAEFLYTVKLCYDLALDRKLSLVEYLQSQIFGSAAPKDISRNLGSWAYLAGHYVSMHDVPRDAIKFNDQTRVKIIDYLADNFSSVVSDREDHLDAVGVFLGRNIQLLAQHVDNEKVLFPHSIYQYMKSHRWLEVAVGQGAGDVFYSLEQPLQQEILSRIEKDGEFARGLGESLGKSFEDLDEYIRKDILSMRIGKSLLFARGLAESLGHNFHKLPKPLQDEVFQISLKENYNFQRGLGTGLGRKFRYLEPSVQKHLIALSSQHIALAIGVGYGLALDYTSSPIAKEFQSDIMALMKENGEITRGLGMGLGQNFSFLSKTLQRELIDWTEGDPRLEFGFAYQLSFLLTSLTKEYQDLVFRRVDRNSEFAYGSGWGFGVVYTYLAPEMQERLLDLARKNMRFATGLGAGIGNQLQYLTEEEEGKLFSIIESNEGFAIGAAFGTGRSFTFLRQELQQRLWRLVQKSHAFAVGLGWGLGFAFSYLHKSLQDKILENVQKESGFAYGFGWGLGFMFTYLSTDFQQRANLLASQNSQFAAGLGLGLGSLFSYLPDDLRQGVWARAEKTVQFATGLGSELGYLFSYLPLDLQQEILSRAESNGHIARGLGWGLGNRFTSLPTDRQQYLFQKIQSNPQMLRGLGWGMGRILSYLPSELQQAAIRMAGTSIQFATGLGEGIGRSFQYLDAQSKRQAIQLSCQNDAIARGLGSGLGHVINYLEPESAYEVWRRAEQDTQFAVGLGEGIGEVIGFLPLSSQEEIFAKLEQNNPLSRGIGAGLGNCASLYLTDKDMSDKLSAFAKKDNDFSRGYGQGLGRIFSYWTRSMLDDVIMPNVALSNQFAIGLGEGVGQSLPYQIWTHVARQEGASRNTRDSATLEKLFESSGFLYGVGIGFSTIIGFMPEQTRTLVLQRLLGHQNFAFGLGYGIGRSFPDLTQKLQEDSFTLAETNGTFATGLGRGIGFSFRHLEPIVQQGLLLLAEKNEGFAAGLGQGIGSVFPSLHQKIQEDMLELAEKKDGFAMGLSQGLGHNVAYLDNALQEKIASLASIKKYANSPLQGVSEFDRYGNDFLVLLNRQEGSGRDIVQEGQGSSILSKEDTVEILFSGRREKYCICYIDMMNSTKISATLDDLQLSKYYSAFLNSMATIAKSFGATIIKNAGDCLIYYFPATSNSSEQSAFKDVIECGITMISAHQAINSKLFEQKLPPLDYRISADYGKVEVARSSSSQSEDLFGSTMNVCAKINAKAPANGMVIGDDLYQMVDSMGKEYDFERVGEYSGFAKAYPIYSIKSRHNRTILNPFKRPAETILDSSFHKDADHNEEKSHAG